MKIKSKNFKNWTASLMALCFLCTISLSSCSDKKKDSESSDAASTTEMMDSTEQASDKAEHPTDGGEHPSDGHEHPADHTDSTASEAAEHPTEGGEHPTD